MVVVKLVGSIVKFGVTRRVSGEKEKTIVFAVHGSVENIDFLMDKPLSLSLEVLQESFGSKT